MFKLTEILLGLPFDMAREQYAKAVRAGFIKHSLLAGAKFERMLSSMEKAALGPWARQV
ncbi:MAG: hypothetical protein V4713_08025 [Pseudomonadota bacterium]